jgi:hypothetical protein
LVLHPSLQCIITCVALPKFETLEDYAHYLQAHPEEVQALYEEISALHNGSMN